MPNRKAPASQPDQRRDARARALELVERGNERARRDEPEGAISLYAEALVLDPSLARAHYNLGVVLQRLGRSEEAVPHYAAAAEAGLSKAWVNWGNVLKDRGDLDAAYELYLRALAADPADTKALVNCGTLLMGRGDLEGASGHYRQALAIDPTEPDALSNLGSIKQQRGRFKEAAALYDRALRSRPGFVDPVYNLALIALHEGDFERGWEGHEARFETTPPAAQLTPLPLPMAGPADLVKGRIAIRREQGLGDQVLFSTLLPELAARGIDAVVETDPRLLAAYRRSLPALAFASPAELAHDVASCDMQFPIGSLPRLFRGKVEDFLSQPSPLLMADPERMRRLGSSLPEGRKIGISWRTFQSGARRHIEQRKSAPLTAFSRLYECGAHLVDLQYGDVEAERAEFDARHPRLRRSIPGLDLFSDLEGVLAAIALCDSVVTTSNITAHLAGALGKRAWVLLAGEELPFHYWARLLGARSLWYPSVEVIVGSDWDQAFAELARRLEPNR